MDSVYGFLGEETASGWWSRDRTSRSPSSSKRTKGSAGSTQQTEDAPSGFAAAGAAIGDASIAEQQRLEHLRRDLVTLEAAFFEDYGAPLDANSKSSFFSFMRDNPAVAQPVVGAESTGTLVATWAHDDEYLSLRFVSRFSLHYAITETTPRGPSRRWGTAHSMIFFDQHPVAKTIASSSS